MRSRIAMLVLALGAIGLVGAGGPAGAAEPTELVLADSQSGAKVSSPATPGPKADD